MRCKINFFANVKQNNGLFNYAAGEQQLIIKVIFISQETGTSLTGHLGFLQLNCVSMKTKSNVKLNKKLPGKL